MNEMDSTCVNGEEVDLKLMFQLVYSFGYLSGDYFTMLFSEHD